MWYFSWILGLLLACSLGILHILRFEAQETFEKEHIPRDRLTGLFTKEVMMTRLNEKVENSRNNGFPFSIITVNLEQFCQQHQLLEYEIETVLRYVADYLKEEMREGVDIAARMSEQRFLIVLTGANAKRAENTATYFKDHILNHIKAPRDLKITTRIGIATYPIENGEPLTIAGDVEGLLRMACKQKYAA